MTQNLLAPQSEDGGNWATRARCATSRPRCWARSSRRPCLYFHAFEVRPAGMLGKTGLIPTGRLLGIPIHNVVGISVEAGVRSRRSRPNWTATGDSERKTAGEKQVNAPPGPLDRSERCMQLLVTCETGSGLEVAVFEVASPRAPADRINAFRASSRV